jgi:hypothetical protein
MPISYRWEVSSDDHNPREKKVDDEYEEVKVDKRLTLSGSAIGLASSLISLEKNSLNVPYFSGSGSFNSFKLSSNWKLWMNGWICFTLAGSSYCSPIFTLWSSSSLIVRSHRKNFS